MGRKRIPTPPGRCKSGIPLYCGEACYDFGFFRDPLPRFGRGGKFNWPVLDTPAQRWIAKGKQVAFRITSSESWTRWATPKWVADAVAKGYNFRPGKGVQADGPFWEPDFDDPVFLAKLDRFLAAMAARYDGNPDQGEDLLIGDLRSRHCPPSRVGRLTVSWA